MNKARIAKRKKYERRKRGTLWVAVLTTVGAIVGEVAYQKAKK